MKALFDTNILIDYLAGKRQARKELARYDESYISVISWMEVRVGITSDEEDIVVRGFLSGFKLVSLSQEVAESAVKIRQGHNVKLPDAIIWASAQTENALLVTRNTKDFGFDDVGIRIPYRL